MAAANLVASIDARIEALRANLTGAAPEQRSSISDTQTRALLALLKAVKKPSADQLAKWVTGITDVCDLLQASDFEALVSTVTQTRSNSGSWTMQNFTSLTRHYTQEDWSTRWLAGGQDLQVPALQVFLFAKASALGCEHPSEPTTKLWISLILCRLLGNAALQLQAPTLDSEHQQLKVAWKKHKDNKSGLIAADITLPPVQHLTMSVASFQAEHPARYNQVFPAEPPVICPIDLLLVHNVNSLFSCRGNARMFAAQPVQRPMLQDNPLQASNSVDLTHHGMKVMMDHFAQMSRMQVEQMRQLAAGRLPLEDGNVREDQPLARKNSPSAASLSGSPRDNSPPRKMGRDCEAQHRGPGQRPPMTFRGMNPA